MQAGIPGLRKSQKGTARTEDKERKPIRQDTVQPLEKPTLCKRRPTETKGNGGSRPFVPWCK